MLLSGIEFKNYYVSKLLSQLKEEQEDLESLNIPFESDIVSSLINYI